MLGVDFGRMEDDMKSVIHASLSTSQQYNSLKTVYDNLLLQKKGADPTSLLARPSSSNLLLDDANVQVR